MNELNQLRRNGAYGLMAACWVFVIGLAASGLYLGRWLPVVAAIAMSIVPSMLAWQDKGTGPSRLAFGVTLPLYPALLLWQWSGDRPQRAIQAARQDGPGARIPELHAARDAGRPSSVPGRRAQ